MKDPPSRSSVEQLPALQRPRSSCGPESEDVIAQPPVREENVLQRDRAALACRSSPRRWLRPDVGGKVQLIQGTSGVGPRQVSRELDERPSPTGKLQETSGREGGGEAGGA